MGSDLSSPDSLGRAGATPDVEASNPVIGPAARDIFSWGRNYLVGEDRRRPAFLFSMCPIPCPARARHDRRVRDVQRCSSSQTPLNAHDSAVERTQACLVTMYCRKPAVEIRDAVQTEVCGDEMHRRRSGGGLRVHFQKRGRSCPSRPSATYSATIEPAHCRFSFRIAQSNRWKDLTSGSLSAAQSDFNTLQQAFAQTPAATSSSTTSNPVAQAFQQLSSDLKSGHLSGAKQDYSSVQQDLITRAGLAHIHYQRHIAGGGGGQSRARCNRTE